MSPYIQLHNETSISSDEAPQPSTANNQLSAPHESRVVAQDFVSYVANLLNKSNESPSQGLLSPSTPTVNPFQLLAKDPVSMKEAVDFAIRKSNLATPSNLSPSRFDITRDGARIATIMLARPAYRLGETVSAIVDFAASNMTCFSLHSVLESWESVDDSIALRSTSSIYRATRRVHALQSDFTASMDRAMFNPVIPMLATPEFITSGVSLEWGLRFEFSTGKFHEDSELDVPADGKLEEIAKDERGRVLAALQMINCDMFDVVIPLHVYGAVLAFDELSKSGEFPI